MNFRRRSSRSDNAMKPRALVSGGHEQRPLFATRYATFGKWTRTSELRWADLSRVEALWNQAQDKKARAAAVKALKNARGRILVMAAKGIGVGSAALETAKQLNDSGFKVEKSVIEQITRLVRNLERPKRAQEAAIRRSLVGNAAVVRRP